MPAITRQDTLSIRRINPFPIKKILPFLQPQDRAAAIDNPRLCGHSLPLLRSASSLEAVPWCFPEACPPFHPGHRTRLNTILSPKASGPGWEWTLSWKYCLPGPPDPLLFQAQRRPAMPPRFTPLRPQETPFPVFPHLPQTSTLPWVILSPLNRTLRKTPSDRPPLQAAPH